MEHFKSPVVIYQGASDTSTKFVWAAFDNTVGYNATGPEGYVVERYWGFYAGLLSS